MTTKRPLCTWEFALETLPSSIRSRIRQNVPMRDYTSLRVGGSADYFLNATDTETLAAIAGMAQTYYLPHFVLGAGSNICVSDAGIRGMVLRCACEEAEIGETTTVDAGHNFMRLFLRTMRAGLSGLEFAVGIPGTVGGALVSNAGAYRGEICGLVQAIDVVEDGRRRLEAPGWMGFSYRDSRLRSAGATPALLLGVRLQLTPAPKRQIRLKAKDFQMQRILKQPWEPSAGSFFKNVNDRELAERLPGLPKLLKDLGKVPAAFLSEACGCKGYAVGGAAVSTQHANFLVNRGNATARDVRAVAEHVKTCVWERFGVQLEEEVLYVGDWTPGEAH